MTAVDRFGGWLGVGVLAVLLASGAGAGVAWASLRDASPAATDDGGARPAVASSPSAPIDPPPELEPDPSQPALATGLALREQQLGTGGFTDTVLAPRAWTRTDSFSNEAKWTVPGHPDYTYVLRQEQVYSQHQGAAAILAARLVELESAVDDFEVLDRTDDSLEFTYVTDGHLRHALLQWVDLGGSPAADLEVSLTGRERDVPGMDALMDRLVAGARD